MSKDLTAIESNFEQIKPIIRMLMPLVGGLDGLGNFFLKAAPSLNDALGSYLESKKEQHSAFFDKGGYNCMSLSAVKFDSQEAGFMLFALKFKEGSSIPESSKPLEIIQTRELIKLLAASIPIDELKKEL